MASNTTRPIDEVSTSEFAETTSSVSIIVAQAAGDITAWYPWALSTVYLILTVGLVLNTITAIAYLKSSLLTHGKPVHQLIFNMTMSDFICCLVGQPFVLFQYTEAGARYIMTRKMACISSFIGTYIGFDSTVTSLLLITCERLFAILFPLQHMHRVTRRTTRWAIIVTWALLTIRSSILFFWNKWSYNVACVGIAVMPDTYTLYIYNTFLYTCMALIVLLNVVLGFAVIVAKRKAQIMKTSQTMTKSMQSQIKSAQSELKIVKIVFLAVSVLFVTWIPNNTFANIVLAYMTNRQAPPFDILVAYHMTRSVVLVGPVADPLIYFLKNSQCREAVLKLMGRTAASKAKHSVDSKTVMTKVSEVMDKSTTDG
ncbi:hypothetical protein CAPTEDRAFT_209237 [Capitella teleta]|uniref:G-protein coupled receptors family 1 profile domain-containing protein n=1 Tax=Capitella teleta TaxID=283909 RepID=R7VME2_CAPTE|nr:hypothetical protein CAPTEDRAFT_209237 [Capitella teleta]|eukprot:ELU18685.1 hypothetical protein CAPTEDRAFT_209237 [Capitella teleta]